MADKAVKLTQFSRSASQIKKYADDADNKVKTEVVNEVNQTIEEKIEEAIEPIKQEVVPAGGKAGQILAKKTDDDGDVNWIDAPSGGGTADSIDWSKVNNKPDFKPVATSGSYNDLNDKPEIPEEYDDTELAEKVDANKSAIETLNGTGEGSVKKKVADEIAKVVAESPEELDTLKEVADYIASDKTKAAEIESAIASLQTNKADKTEIPEIATAATAGLVKPGSGLNITSDGTLVVTTPVDGNTKTAATYTVEYDEASHSFIRRKLADDGQGYDSKFTPQTIELPEWATVTALDAKAAQSEVNALANAGAKNLLKNGADSVTKTYNGVTATLNSDGSLTINGTATSDFYYYFVKDFVLKAGKYILSNGKAGNSNVMLQMNGEATASVVATDAEVTLETDATVNIFARVRSGGTANNITFYPMLRSASITDDTYVPYGMSNAELTEEIKGRALNGSSEYVQFSQDAAISKANVSGKGIQDGIDLVGRDADGKQWLARLHHAEKQITLMHTDGSTWTTDATFTADEDTGWQTPDPTNLPNFKYRRKNGHVTVTGYGGVGGVAAKTTKTLFTLPEGFRPSIRVDSAAHLANGSNEPVCQFLATTDGKVNVWANTEIASGVSVCGSICFPV